MTTKTKEAAPKLEPPNTSDLKIQAKKFVMQSLFEKASAVLPNRDIIPVLKNFQVRVTDEPLVSVIATDMELSVIATTSLVTVERAGTAVFPGKRLLDIVKEADDESDMTIDVSEGVASINVKRTDWELHLKPGDDYPVFPSIDKLKFQEVERAPFLAALSSVRKAAGREQTRAYLMLVAVTADGRMRASDGVRLQQIEMLEWPEGLEIQIPITAVDTLVKLLRAATSETFLLAEDPEFLAFRIGADTYIAAKLVVDFPDMDKQLLAPAMRNKMELSVDRDELMSAIRRVRITADPETSAVVLSLRKNRLRVWAKDKFDNVASEELDVSWAYGATDVVFHHHHLIEMLEMTTARTCLFRLGEGTKTKPAPLLLRDDAARLTGVLLPLRKDFTL